MKAIKEWFSGRGTSHTGPGSSSDPMASVDLEGERPEVDPANVDSEVELARHAEDAELNDRGPELLEEYDAEEMDSDASFSPKSVPEEDLNNFGNVLSVQQPAILRREADNFPAASPIISERTISMGTEVPVLRAGPLEAIGAGYFVDLAERELHPRVSTSREVPAIYGATNVVAADYAVEDDTDEDEVDDGGEEGSFEGHFREDASSDKQTSFSESQERSMSVSAMYEGVAANASGVEEYANRLLDYARTIQELEGERSELMARNAELEAQNRTEQRRTSDGSSEQREAADAWRQMQALKLEVQKEKSARAVLEREMDTLAESLKNREMESSDLHVQVTGLSMTLTEAENDKVRCLKQQATLQEQLAESRGEAERLAGILATVDRDSEATARKLEEQSELVESLRSSLRELQAGTLGQGDSAALSAALGVAEKEKEALRSRINELMVESRRIVSLQEQLADSSRTKGTLEQSNLLLQAQLAAEQAAKDALQAQLIRAEEQASNNAARVQELQLDIQSLEKTPRDAPWAPGNPDEQEYISGLSRRLQITPAPRTPLVAKLTRRLEQMLADRRHCQSVIDHCRYQISSKEEELQQLRASQDNGECMQRYRDERDALRREVELLQNETGALREQLSGELSFLELPEDRVNDSSFAEGSEQLLSAVDELQAINKELQESLNERDQRISSLMRSLSGKGELLKEKDGRLAELKEKHQKEFADAMGIVEEHTSRLQELLRHETQSNAELRTMLEESERSAHHQVETINIQVLSLREKLDREEQDGATTEAWMWNMLRNIDGRATLPAAELPTEELRKRIGLAIEHQQRTLEHVRHREAKLDSMERTIAELQFQKKAILQVYALRQERPPGLPWRNERASSAQSRLRGAFSAILMAVRLKNLQAGSDRRVVAIDASQFFELHVPPALWLSQPNDMSASSARSMLVTLEKALDDNRAKIAELEASNSATELQLIEAQTHSMAHETVKELMREKDEVTTQLVREREEKARLEKERVDLEEDASRRVFMAQAEAAAEKEARLFAEGRSRKYMRRLEEYTTALQKARAGSRARDKSILNALSSIQQKMHGDHPPSRFRTSTLSAEPVDEKENALSAPDTAKVDSDRASSAARTPLQKLGASPVVQPFTEFAQNLSNQ